MTLYITPAMMHEAYRLLCTTPPFRGWKMPRAGEVTFVVSRDPALYGAYLPAGRKGPRVAGSLSAHYIEISARNVGSLPVLLQVMSHEMTHMRDWALGTRKAEHGARFRRLARAVCKHHTLDRRAF